MGRNTIFNKIKILLNIEQGEMAFVGVEAPPGVFPLYMRMNLLSLIAVPLRRISKCSAANVVRPFLHESFALL